MRGQEWASPWMGKEWVAPLEGRLGQYCWRREKWTVPLEEEGVGNTLEGEADRQAVSTQEKEAGQTF